MSASTGTVGTAGPSRPAGPVAAALSVWLALVLLLGADGAFVARAGRPPVALLAGFLTPLAAFALAYFALDSFRGFVLALDLRLVAGIQAWRFAGFGFIALAVHGILPGAFAWSAGLGDMAIGVAAPWIVLALVRRPGFAGTWTFVVWNLLGVLDLVSALSTGALGSLLARGVAGEVTTAPMAQLPLVLIPAFLVPTFAMLHIVALVQSRREQALAQTTALPSRVSSLAA